MGMETGLDKEMIIAKLHERLNWFQNEASEQEYCEEEVQAIRNLLDVMESEQLDETYYNPEKAFERFRQTMDIRMRIQDEMRRFQAGEVSLADYPEEADASYADEKTIKTSIIEKCLSSDSERNEASKEEPISSKSIKKFIFSRRSGMYKGIMAAALVVALLVGGTVGAYAEKKGFFQWVKKDKDRIAIITSPEMMEDSFGNSKKYITLNDVPEKYHKYIWKPENVPDGLKFDHYEVIKLERLDEISILYKNNDMRMKVSSKVFASDVEYHTQKYDEYEYLYSQKYNNIDFEFFKKVSEDETEYVISFWLENVQRIIQGNLSLNEMEILAKQYSDSCL